MDKNFELVKNFFIAYYGPRFYKVLLPETDLNNDVGITGDEAYEFLVAFSEKFNLDTSEFIFLKYFEEEGFLINFMFLRTRKNKYFNMKKLPLTLADLAKMIETGRMV